MDKSSKNPSYATYPLWGTEFLQKNISKIKIIQSHWLVFVLENIFFVLCDPNSILVKTGESSFRYLIQIPFGVYDTIDTILKFYEV
ncbi:hypothetical protein BES34_002855 [Leptospira inadai serovar Lyme]|uniref:Uncharacterized protein n=1 Tax=Leptospira inadai serovar Lyme TaxID=293084 RepID=A0ABX4YMW7_9LEPT|nr:hypothetical protein BES34_002855 [Leptospira inadai serovar Lyme]